MEISGCRCLFYICVYLAHTAQASINVEEEDTFFCLKSKLAPWHWNSDREVLFTIS